MTRINMTYDSRTTIASKIRKARTDPEPLSGRRTHGRGIPPEAEVTWFNILRPPRPTRPARRCMDEFGEARMSLSLYQAAAY